MIVSEFRPGQLVRFRVGERLPERMPCCGGTIDTFELFKEFSGCVFRIDDTFSLRVCPLCGGLAGDDSDRIILVNTFDIGGTTYTAFGAYPEELTPVEATDA